MRAARTALLAGALLGGAAGACEADGVLVFPSPGAVVPVNVEFILEGAGAEQSRVSELTGTDRLVLHGKGDEVPVKVERGWISPMHRVAVKLKPARALKPNLEYTLSVDRGLPKVRLLNDLLGDNAFRWTAGTGPDKLPPRYVSKPGVAEGYYDKAKDGALTRWLKLRTAVEDDSPVYFLVTLQRSRGSAAVQQYPVPMEGGYLQLGHDACSGAFGFDDGRAYKLQLLLYDSAGNRSPEKVTLELSAPKPTAPPPAQ